MESIKVSGENTWKVYHGSAYLGSFWLANGVSYILASNDPTGIGTEFSLMPTTDLTNLVKNIYFENKRKTMPRVKGKIQFEIVNEDADYSDLDNFEYFVFADSALSFEYSEDVFSLIHQKINDTEVISITCSAERVKIPADTKVSRVLFS